MLYGVCDVFCDICGSCDACGACGACDACGSCDACGACGLSGFYEPEIYVHAETDQILMVCENACDVFFYLQLMKIPYYSINKEKNIIN